MSPDRTTITRAEAIRRRKEEEQNRREQLTLRNVAKPKPAPAAKTSARAKSGWSDTTRSVSPSATNRIRRSYDMAASAPFRQTRRAAVHNLPEINIRMPRIGYGPRWLSIFIALFCLLDLYFMLNSSPFIVSNAEISGNNRINTQEIQSVLGIENQSVVSINPTQIESNILASFPDVASASVSVDIPNGVHVMVEERVPVAVWQQQSGETFWVDSLGYKFQPRGQVDGLPIIMANGNPPVNPNEDSEKEPVLQPFLPADLSKTIEVLSQNLPQGSNLVFDPQYGLGWNDPKGWKVFFGHSYQDSTLKLQVYQSMLDHLAKENIQPAMISVEYPNAPFYRVEQ
jgi:cell division protein FtsQ